MKNYIEDQLINHNKSYIIGIIGIWTSLVIGQWCFHSTWSTMSFDDFIPENTSYEKYLLEFISTFWRNISLSFEELVPVMVFK